GAERGAYSAVRKPRDEHYILDLCDEFLGQRASRQHRFDFLLGNRTTKGRQMRLAVDGYYPELRLVVEYHERQHFEAVVLFDKPDTAIGMPRSEQRALYDQRRRDELPKHGIVLVELSVREFAHSKQLRLNRLAEDKAVI